MTGTDASRSSVIAARVAIAALVWFVAAVSLMHVLRPDYIPARHFISDYAVGRYGGVMTSAFIALALGSLALGVGLARSGPRAGPGRLGVIPLFVAAAGLVVTAIFETDLPGAPYTRAGDIHNASFLVNVGSLMLAALLLSWGFGGDARWREFRRTSRGLVVLALAAFAFQFLSLRKGAPYGIANRVFALTLVAWLLATSFRLSTLLGSAQRDRPDRPGSSARGTRAG